LDDLETTSVDYKVPDEPKILKGQQVGDIDQSLVSTLKLASDTEKLIKSTSYVEIQLNDPPKDLVYRPIGGPVKLTPDRILCSTWHPSPRSLILCAGAKYGNLSIYTHSEDEKTVHEFNPHETGISALMFSKIDQTKLYSASYDGSIRLLDINSQSFDQMFKHDDLISSMDIHQHNIYFGNGSGLLFHSDTRQHPDVYTQDFEISEKKISSVHINPSNPNYIITAGLDRTWKLWDLRNISDKVNLFEHQHSKSCTSAYFNEDGSHIVSTSYDDTLQVFSFNNSQVKRIHTIKHNNQTGLKPFPNMQVDGLPTSEPSQQLNISISAT
jgi:WD40 repeat protein